MSAFEETNHADDAQTDRDGGLIQQLVNVGTGMDATWNSFLQFRYHYDRILTGGVVLPRSSGYVTVQTSPSQLLNNLSLEARFGQFGFDLAQQLF